MMVISDVKTVCSWCNVLIQEGDDSMGVSHGMCQECKDKEFGSLYDLINTIEKKNRVSYV